jgi:HlyD family secretion protein
VNRKILFIAAAAGSLVACNKQTQTTVTIQTATVQRRDIVVQAEATGVIEPITVVEVKSKTASGQVTDMAIEVGSYIRPGDLIVQIDTTDLHTNLVQYMSDRDASQSSYDLAKTVLDRNKALFDQRVITKDVLEQSQNAETSARAQLLSRQTQVTLQLQKLKDSRVVAAAEGTILTRPVAKGQVVQAGSGGVSAGTVIATMADLSKVRARALVSETEIGQVITGQDAVVTVDAFPDRAFNGTVEKIEPSAVVQQNVTMFPVLISLDNSEGLLRPGMNGEVSVRTDSRDQVLSVPNDAIRNTREWEIAAKALSLNADSVRAKVMPSGGGRNGGGATGAGRGGNAGGAPATGGRQGNAGGAAGGPQASTSRAELDPLLQGGTQGGEGRRGGRGQMPEVTDAQCAAVTKALAAKPAVAKKLDDIRSGMRGASDEQRQQMRAQQEAAYKELGVDQMVAGACRFREGGGRGGNAGAGAAGGAAGGGGMQGAAGMQGGAQQFGGGAAGGRRGRGGAGGGAARRENPNATPRSGLVFVQKNGTWEPRVLRLGIANYDFTEVISGVEDGEKVALMAAAILQLRRQEQMDRTKAMASPLGGGGAMGGMGGGRGGPGGGGPPGGGRGN